MRNETKDDLGCVGSGSTETKNGRQQWKINPGF